MFSHAFSGGAFTYNPIQKFGVSNFFFLNEFYSEKNKLKWTVKNYFVLKDFSWFPQKYEAPQRF